MAAVSNDVLAAQMANIAEDMAEIKQMIVKNHAALYGNGSSEKGLCSRLGVVETVTSRLEKALWLIVSASLTATVGAIVALVRTGV